MTQNGWYRASDGNWYFGQDPRPYAAPPAADGRGGWHPPVPLRPVQAAPAHPAPTYPAPAYPAPVPPPPGAADSWLRRNPLTAGIAGGVLLLVLVGAALSGGGGDDTEPAAAPLPLVATSQPERVVEPVETAAPTPPPTTRAARPSRPPATTPPPVRKTVRPKPRVTTPAPVRTTVAAPRTDPHFGTCREAIANGYGPYRQGVDEEYDWYRDADSDGVVCER